MTEKKVFLSVKKVLLVGASGFLGASLKDLLPSKELLLTIAGRDEVDLSESLSSEFRMKLCEERFDYVIIAAAITDVEKCFQDQKHSHQVNVRGTMGLLDAVRAANAVPVFFSSDYVFEPVQALHQEEDPRLPQTVYGQQKLTIEKYIETQFPEFLIFRTSKLMSKTRHPRNILTPLLQNLAKGLPTPSFENQWLNPVFVEDIAAVLARAFQVGLSGIYHSGTKTVFTRAGLARSVAQALGYDPALIYSVQMSALPFSEPRPQFNTLNCKKIEESLGFRFVEVLEALPEFQL